MSWISIIQIETFLSIEKIRRIEKRASTDLSVTAPLFKDSFRLLTFLIRNQMRRLMLKNDKIIKKIIIRSVRLFFILINLLLITRKHTDFSVNEVVDSFEL